MIKGQLDIFEVLANIKEEVVKTPVAKQEVKEIKLSNEEKMNIRGKLAVEKVIKKNGFLKLAHKVTHEIKVDYYWGKYGEEARFDYKATYKIVCAEIKNMRKNFDCTKISYHTFLSALNLDLNSKTESCPRDCKMWIESLKELDKINFQIDIDFREVGLENISEIMLIENDLEFISPMDTRPSIEYKKHYRALQVGLHNDKYKFNNGFLRELFTELTTKIKEQIQEVEEGEWD